MKETSYNKKGIPNYVVLGTIPNKSLVPTYTVGTIFISMISKAKITIIRSIMILRRYFSIFLIISPPFALVAKGNST